MKTTVVYRNRNLNAYMIDGCFTENTRCIKSIDKYKMLGTLTLRLNDVFLRKVLHRLMRQK